MMELEKIVAVVRKHHLMTLATVAKAEGGTGEEVFVPWVAHVFYAWVKELECFVFTSDPETRHGKEMVAGPVAAGVGLETKNVGKVQGIQICGSVRRPIDGAEKDAARSAYLRRFPYAAAMGAAGKELSLWILEPSYMKLTDNTLGFGTKLTWSKE